MGQITTELVLIPAKWTRIGEKDCFIQDNKDNIYRIDPNSQAVEFFDNYWFQKPVLVRLHDDIIFSARYINKEEK